MNEDGPTMFTCTAARPNGGICGFTTPDPAAHCPHDGIIVSTGERFTAPKAVRICPTCHQPWPEALEPLPKVSGTMEPAAREELENEQQRRLEQERAHSQPAFAATAEETQSQPKGHEEENEGQPYRPDDGSHT